jgi:hypothetical protein
MFYRSSSAADDPDTAPTQSAFGDRVLLTRLPPAGG